MLSTGEPLNLSKRRRSFSVAVLVLAFASRLYGQQVPDSAFRFLNAHPSFPASAGPVVCVDAAHQNFHTLDNRYYAFGKLIRDDGFRTTSLTERLDRAVLADCAVLVIANASAVPAGEPGADFNAPAFRSEEITRVLEWVIGGGRLLLVMDHSPWPAAAANLAAALGVVPLNGGATYYMFGELPQPAMRAVAQQEGITADSVRRVLGARGLGTFGDHAILRGRPGVDTPVRTLLTFGGSAFYPARDVRPLLKLAAQATGRGWSPERFHEHAPRYVLDGWLVGGARQVGAGRVVVLGEAAMCSAQLGGPARYPMGMNNPLAVDNAQFCLNVIRWLASVIQAQP